MMVEFERLHAAGWSPIETAAIAESRGISRLEVFKAIHTHWGAEHFTVAQLSRYGTNYPSRAARAAATIGLAVLVLHYPQATAEDFATFDRITGMSRKVEALAKADRPDEALTFYDRLETEALVLRPISEAEARAAVRAVRAERSSLSSTVVDRAVPHPWGWYFAPDPGDETPATRVLPPGSEALPIIFDRYTGVVIEIDSNEPPAEIIARYDETGWPLPQPG